jgi:magnesium transporter
MITVYHSSSKARRLSKIETAKTGSWVHVVEPTDEDLDRLVKELDLDRDILDDVTDIYEAPRIEIAEDESYIFTRYCHPEGQDIATEPLLIVYTNHNIITIMRRSDIVLDNLLKGDIGVLTTQKTKMFLHILEAINRSYRTQLNSVSKQVLRMRSRLRQAEISNIEFVSFIELEEDLNEFLTALQPQTAVLTSLRTGRYMKLYEEDKDQMEDLALNTTELIELTKSRLRTLVNIRQAYDTIATNNLNKIFKRLTSIGIFLTVPMIFVGFWGMNVALPLEDRENAALVVSV